MSISKISELLGDQADNLLNHKSSTIDVNLLHKAGPDFIDRSFVFSNRNPQVLKNLQALYNGGRLGGSGYLSIFPVD